MCAWCVCNVFVCGVCVYVICVCVYAFCICCVLHTRQPYATPPPIPPPTPTHPHTQEATIAHWHSTIQRGNTHLLFNLWRATARRAVRQRIQEAEAHRAMQEQVLLVWVLKTWRRNAVHQRVMRELHERLKAARVGVRATPIRPPPMVVKRQNTGVGGVLPMVCGGGGSRWDAHTHT